MIVNFGKQTLLGLGERKVDMPDREKLGEGYPIEVLKDYAETMNRYAFLLVE